MNHAGELLRNNKTVAMKFAPSSKGLIESEYVLYSYMGAIDNSTVENFGVSAVFYYGKWQDLSMIAITPLDSQFSEIKANRKITLSDLDIFIICREYVSI